MIITPKKIIQQTGNIVNSNALLVKKETQINLNERNVATFTGKSHIILDFGKEICGGIRILTKDICGSKKIHIRFGESISETCSHIGEFNSTNDHSPRDLIYELTFLSDIKIGSTGFRFVRIDIESDDVIWNVKNIYAVSEKCKKIEGYFVSDDELLNKIFSTASYTNSLCIRNSLYWDGIKRDRLCWIGDSYPIYKAASYLYKSNKELLNSLKFAMVEAPLPLWVNYSPMYSFWWMYLLSEYYVHRQNKKEIKPLINYLNGLIKQIDTVIDKDGNFLNLFLFIDWPSHYDPNSTLGNDEDKKYDEIAGCTFLSSIVLKEVRNNLSDFLTDENKHIIERLIASLNKKKLDVIKFKQIASLGIINDSPSKNMIKILSNGHANGFSTFQSYFILKAMAKLSLEEDALYSLKQYYGGMLDIGATTFFEDFDLNWTNNVTRIDELPIAGKGDFHRDNGDFCYKGFRHSLCHGWSSGVIAYIFENIVGVKMSKPGEKEFIISPNLLTINNITCAFATQYGLVHLKINKNKIVYKAPKQVHIIIKNK